MRVTLTITDEFLPSVEHSVFPAQFLQEITNAGMTIENELPLIGVLMGEVRDESVLDKLRSVKGVLAVTKERTLYTC